MEKIYFDDSTFIWKTKFDISDFKDGVLDECSQIMEAMGEIPGDNFGYFTEWTDLNFSGEIIPKAKLDFIAKFGIDRCIELFDATDTPYNKVNTDAWVNVVRAINPKQHNFKKSNEIEFHNHIYLNELNKIFVPTYTYVHYIQMPDNLEGNDGVLYIEGKNKEVYHILPQENDVIIMESGIPHVPASSYKSTKDRIVFAGNVGFDLIKKEKSLI
jgi:hypothetical protein